jgi:hypothetical protein
MQLARACRAKRGGVSSSDRVGAGPRKVPFPVRGGVLLELGPQCKAFFLFEGEVYRCEYRRTARAGIVVER